jgi:mono/diheme cytochrome c family protein
MLSFKRSGGQKQLFLNKNLLDCSSLVLKRLRGIACAVLCVAFLWPSAAAGQAAKGAPVTKAKAAELFTANCQICHGPEGTGTPLAKDMAFVGRKWKHGSRLPDVVATITNGVPATPMLPFKGRLTPAEINALASLVRSFDKTLKPASTGGKR